MWEQLFATAFPALVGTMEPVDTSAAEHQSLGVWKTRYKVQRGDDGGFWRVTVRIYCFTCSCTRLPLRWFLTQSYRRLP